MKNKLSSLLSLFILWAGVCSAQFVSVISPNGGETWQTGSGQIISWTSVITPGATIDLYLSYDNGQTYVPIALGVVDVGFYQINQVTGPPSSQCLVKIMESGNPAINDSSDAVFSIVPGQPLIDLISPNGGEFIPVGGTRNVLWSSANIDSIKIELSTNGGTTWSVLQSGVPAAQGFTPVFFPGPQNINCLLKISDQNNASVSDVSSASFQIRNPFISVQTPLNNEVLEWGDEYFVSYQAAIVNNLVDIEFSSDGVNYDTVAFSQPNFGSYTWTVPSGITSSTCYIAVRESNNPPVVNVRGPFRVQAPVPTVNILYPNGGESFVGTNSINVQFSSENITSGIIEYSVDSMQTWLPIGTFVQGETSLPWLLPGNVNSDDCFIRGYDISGGNQDTSNAGFQISIPVPTVLISTPFGNEVWAIGSQQQISWASNYISQVKIEFSNDGGNTWSTIEPSWNAAATPYIWTVTGPASQNCFVRISDALNPSVNASNSIPFNVVNPYVLVNLPNGGEILSAGNLYNIQWTGSVFSGLVDIDYSIDNGATWQNIVSNYATLGGFVWQVPNTPSANCKIRISESGNPAVSDQSDAVFTITPAAPQITVTAPLFGDTWTVGNGSTIQWIYANINLVDIFLSTDSGVTFNPIASSVSASQGFYIWPVIAQASSNAYILVKDAQSAAADTSERFTIFSSIVGIQVLNPVGGEIFPASSVQNISWIQGGAQAVNIEYSYNNGQNWLAIANNIPFTTNTFSWTIPPFISSQYLIRISDANDPTIFGITPNFSVVPAFLEVISPNGGETIGGLSPFVIGWQGQGIASNVILEYSLNNGLTWNTIVSNIPNSGTYTWLSPAVQSSQCRVRVRTLTAPLLSDVSDAAFTLNFPGPVVRINSPNGGENLGAGQTVNIEFLTNFVNYVKLEYSVNSGLTWQPIINVYPAQNGVYSWVIPQGINSQAMMLKISNAANISLTDLSDAVFSVGPPSITLLSPNGGELFNPGTVRQISWTGTGISALVKLDYSVDSMQSWINIQPSVQNTGSFNFSVPNLPSSNVFFKVTDALNTAISDISNASLVISGTSLGAQQVLFPNGGEQLAAGQALNVSWDFPQSSSLNIQLSTDNGASWSSLASSVNALAGSTQLVLPQLVSSQCLIKISDAGNSAINDVSDNVFSIGNRSILLNPLANSYTSGSPIPLSWNSFGIDFVNLYFSSNGGSTWSVIDTNIYNQQSYVYPLPAGSGSNNRILITATDFSAVRDSSQIFSLNNSNQISWVSPQQNLSRLPGTSIILQWQGSGYNFVKLEFSNNGGSNWQTVIDSLSMQQGVFSWTVQGAPTNAGKFRITGFGNGTPQTLLAPFTLNILSGAPSVVLNSPNGGEIFQGGALVPLTWSSNNAGLLDISLSTNGGTSYTPFAIVPASSGSFLWQVPVIVSGTVRIKLSVNGIPAVQDASNANFSIVSSTATGQSIEIDSTTNLTVCRGDSLFIPFRVNGNIAPGSTFHVFVSDVTNTSLQPLLLKSFAYSGNIIDSVMTPVPATFNPGYYNLYLASQAPAVMSAVSNNPLHVQGFNLEISASTRTATIPGSPVSFSVSPSGSNYSYNWDFGFTTSTSANPQINFLQPGFYTLKLVMQSSAGCSSSIELPEFLSANYLFFSDSVNLQNDSSDFVSVTYHAPSSTWTAVSAEGDIARSTDAGVWQNADQPLTPYLSNRTSALRGQELYSSGLNGKTLRSLDFGLTWTPISLQTTEAVNDMVFSSVDDGLSCGSNGMVRRFNGSVWQAAAVQSSAELNACHTGFGYRLVAGAAGTIRRGVLSNWDTINSPLLTTWYDILMRDSLSGYICGSNGSIIKTNDAGLSWQTVMTGFPTILRKLLLSGDTIWAAGDMGIIMESSDAGNSWIRKAITPGLDIYSLAFNRVSGKGFLVGKNGLLREFGTQYYVAPPPPSILPATEIETGIVMYPNPARESVMFSGLHPDKQYNLSIFSSDGRLVMNALMRGEALARGINISQYSSGLYIVNIGTSEWVERQRLILTR